MSAQVTEAHRELARRIMFEFTQAGTATASDVRMAAQIIADSEAKAVQSAQDIKSEWAYATMNERNQLRAERDYNHECINRLATATGTLGEKSERVVEVALSTIARAERAEAELNESRYETVKAAQEGLRECIRAERAEAKVRVLREALQALRDQQNNADRPLCRAHWQMAMDEAGLALAATEGDK